MDNSFLQQVAHQIFKDDPTGRKRSLVVFNNRRSGRFLNKAIAEVAESLGQGTYFSPDIMVIDELVSQLGGLKIVSSEFLLFELYQIHTEIGGENRKYATFEEFISFGELMMSDFSEIDQYRVDAKAIFGNLSDIKAIEQWNPGKSGLTDFQKNYLEFYRNLYTYYTKLHERLMSQGEAYSGMAYRNVAENIGQLAAKLQYDHIYFVGFNAMSECERAIIGEYVRLGIGHLMTDNDTYYYDLENERNGTSNLQEAGYFLRKHDEEFPELAMNVDSHFDKGEKSITIVKCAENVLQCKYAGHLMSQIKDWDEEARKTAVVLADESLLIPTLNALPEKGKYNVNVSMGFAYADSNIHTLILKVIALHKSQNERGFYHSDLVEVLSDFYIGLLLSRSHLRHSVSKYMEDHQLVRCTTDELHKMTEAIHVTTDSLKFLFPTTKPSIEELLSILRQLASALLESTALSNDKKELQALGGLTEILSNLTELQEKYQYIQTVDSFEKIYSRIASRHNIAFIGDPLTDLQMLGMLETRNLDFERVLILSVNEGSLPAGRGNNTLIPMDLKREFKLPTYEEKDCVFAYHFYRLLQRATDIYLFYSAESEALGKGEPSRFILQIENELAKRYRNIKINKITVNAQQVQPISETGYIETQPKGPVADRLQEISQKGFSPSALSNYLECPLKYYYSNVLGLNDDTDIEDDINASQLGTAVHKVMEDIYKQRIGQVITADWLTKIRSELNNYIDAAFEELFSHGRNNEGRNIFMKSVANKQLEAILEKEITVVQRHELEIVALEREDLTYTLKNGAVVSGRVDRIDRLDGQLRVIDYKTGKVPSNSITASDELRIEPFDPSLLTDIHDKWLQLMTYALVYLRNEPKIEPVTVGIYPLAIVNSDVMAASWGAKKTMDGKDMDDFERILTYITDEILNIENPFSAVPKDCKYCVAGRICRSNKPQKK